MCQNHAHSVCLILFQMQSRSGDLFEGTEFERKLVLSKEDKLSKDLSVIDTGRPMSIVVMQDGASVAVTLDEDSIEPLRELCIKVKKNWS